MKLQETTPQEGGQITSGEQSVVAELRGGLKRERGNLQYRLGGKIVILKASSSA